MPYSPKILRNMVDMLPPDAIFGVSGIGPAQLPCIANALLLGGHIRVRLLELTQRAVRICEDLGYELATPAEAREILGLRQLGA